VNHDDQARKEQDEGGRMRSAIPTPVLKIPNGLAGPLLAAVVTIGGLLAAPTAYGSPAEAADCFNPEVTSLTGPPKLSSDGTGTIVATATNPNPVGTCDDGLAAQITFNGTADAISSIDGGPDVVCSKDGPGAFAYTERCLASAFGGGATVTITFDVQNVVRPDRIAVGVKSVTRADQKEGYRPGKVGYLDLMVSVPVSTPGPPGGPPPSGGISNQTTGQLVQKGASGPNVEAIQYLLRLNRQDIGVDGDFGDQTDAAVRSYQRTKGLTVDGVVGPQTWQALWVTVKQGDQGDAVSAAQTLLAWHQQDIQVDGGFGDQTEAAVRAFQGAKGLTADGIVGPQTWTALVNSN